MSVQKQVCIIKYKINIGYYCTTIAQLQTSTRQEYARARLFSLMVYEKLFYTNCECILVAAEPTLLYSYFSQNNLMKTDVGNQFSLMQIPCKENIPCYVYKHI